ncbi:MAG: 4-hydroxy-tetrahydrodipicolinate reductase [Bacteroidota bacterium]|nr:4-hydroxy-tetrahydrodipicolinate reductase [Bacteroidota bacterium]MDP4216725.1 4-hydroxy-tetrahydrodipicolinate reductase [Bacteroidota bacterium]MDP4247492.1 4-hydroxy-tetrahydrodipicolinate reductase [Bacteroidota bacterium]MDP4254445.1 4-hydroxy-tetrahydrodipicolinate reductase [Bacteroidota bacterium]MDP4259269.1 4-hydroxy-tetrahydrodipicolinate reductase [Bacteroidota bacterium]
MRIALIGYGKMGKAIEGIALTRGHEIVLRTNIDNLEDNIPENIRKADVAIEFTGPESAFDNIMLCMESGVPVVSGSTGWLDRYDEAAKYCRAHGKAFLYASNFSIGVNIFFELNKYLATLIAPHPEYNVSLTEIHHTQKKDAPSGTAITLADQVLERIRSKKSWVNHISDNLDELEIISQRTDPAPGTHIVKYQSAIDDIEIVHTAHSREGFATGAVLAAEFIRGKKGVFSMKDVLGF